MPTSAPTSLVFWVDVGIDPYDFVMMVGALNSNLIFCGSIG